MELFHTPDTAPDAPNTGSNTRSKPAGLGNQVRELDLLGLLPDFDEDLLPTPTTGYSGRDPDKWRAERKPSNVGNERKITDLQVAMVELETMDDEMLLLPTPMAQQAGNTPESWLRQASQHSATPRKRVGDLAVLVENGLLETGGELPVLPTPSAVDGSGGSMIQSLDALREGRRQKHLTDLPRMLELEAEQLPLLPTPVVNDMGAGKTPEQWDEWTDDLKSRGYGNGNGHGNSLSVEVLRAEGEALLPTPQTRDATGGKPEAVNRGRGYGADLNDVAAAGLLDQAPTLFPTPMAGDPYSNVNPESRKRRGFGPDLPDVVANQLPAPLLPTPMSRDHQTGKRYALDPSHRFGPNLNDVATAGALGVDPVLPTPMARDHRAPSPAEALRHSPGLSSIGALLPTPAARDATGGQPSRLDRTQGAFLNDVAAAGLLPAVEPDKVRLLPTPTTSDSRGASCGGAHDENVRVPRLAAAMEVDLPAELAAEKLKLLPTPTTLDHVEKRTTHAGGNPTLQGAVCGTNPVDAERLGVRGNDPLLPTPTMRDVGGGRQHTERSTTNGIRLAEALREIPLMPTPQATDHMCGSTTLQGRIDSNRQVMLPHVVRDLPLLPTPTRSDGSGGGVRTNLTWEGTTRSTGDGGNSRLRDVVGLFGLDEALPMLPTPRSADHKGTDSASERSRNTPGLGAISVYYDTSLDDAQDEDTDLMPTPQARDWKGAPGRNYKNRNLARDMERLAAERDAPAADEPEPEFVVNQHGDEQYVLFPTPNVGARNVRNSPGEMARRTPALGAVVADLVENDDPLLPTPQSADQLTGAPMTDRPSRRDRQVDLSTALTREMVANDIPLLPTPNVGAREVRNSPGEMARVHPALGAVIADLAELGEDSRFHGTPLLPTPKTAEKRTSRRAVMESHSRSGPSMGQALEIAQGVLPHEFNSWEELPPGWQPNAPLLPTPVVTDSCGTRNSTAWRSDPESKAKIGDTLTDAMWKLAADRGEMDLPTGPVQARFTDTALLPTPVARDCNGHIQAPTADVGNNGRSVSLGDVLSRLPEGGGTLTMLPTPNAADGDRGGSDPDRLRERGHMVKLIDAVLDGELQEKEILMPTPKSRQRGDCPSERERESPDLAATTLHFPAGRWGKYGPAVERWEKLTRPAPAPTEPNKNGNPRLTARFSEWLLGWPEGWVTDPEIGIARTGQLRLIGNGVVPQQAATALVMLLRDEIEERKRATPGV